MVDVFISYSRSDHAKVAQIAGALAAEGYDVWWDADLPPHQSYGDVITAKIGAARAAIVVWSHTAAQSEWVRAEADMARNQKKLVQTALDDVMPPLPFNQIQFAPIGDWRGEPDHPGWRKVRASLAELCGRDAPAPPRRNVPPPPPAPAAPSRWPLLAGGALALAGVAAAGGALLSRQSPAPGPSATATPDVPAPAPTVVVTERVREVVVPRGGADTPAPMIPPPTAGEGGAPAMLFPDSSVRQLDPAELAPLDRRQLRLARNEIFARAGRRFRDPALTQYFNQFAWYRPTGFDVALGPVAQRNVALIAAAEIRAR